MTWLYHHFLTHMYFSNTLPHMCVSFNLFYFLFSFFFKHIGGSLNCIGYNPQLGRKRTSTSVLCPQLGFASMTDSKGDQGTSWARLSQTRTQLDFLTGSFFRTQTRPDNNPKNDRAKLGQPGICTIYASLNIIHSKVVKFQKL